MNIAAQLKEMTRQRDALLEDQKECEQHLSKMQDSIDEMTVKSIGLRHNLIADIGRADRAIGAGMLVEARSILANALDDLQLDAWPRPQSLFR